MNQAQFRHRPPLGRVPQGPLAKLTGLLISAVLLIAGFMFSLFALAAIAVVGTLLGGWLWWKTRALRRQMRDAASTIRQPPSPSDNDVIEGEFVRETSPASGKNIRPSH